MKSKRLIKIEMTNRCIDERGRLIVGKAFAGKKSKVTTYENPKTHKTFVVVSSLDDNPVDNLLDELDTYDQADEICGVYVNELEDKNRKLEHKVKTLEEYRYRIDRCHHSVNVETMNSIANKIDDLDTSNPNDKFMNGVRKLEQAAKSFDEYCDCIHDSDPVFEEKVKDFSNSIKMACQVISLGLNTFKSDHENDRLEKEKENQ